MERKIPESLIKFVKSLPANEKMMLIDADSYLEILADDYNTVVRQAAKRKLSAVDCQNFTRENHVEPDYATVIGNAIISMMAKDPDFMIKETIRFMYISLEDEESETEELLRYGSFKNAMSVTDTGVEKGCMMYIFMETLAASAFGGDDDVFHRTYEKLKDKLRNLYEISLTDFECAKRLFISYYGLV